MTAVFDSHAEQLDTTFKSFSINPSLELHAFVVGDKLPQRRVGGITYHLRPPDASYINQIRDVDFRRWSFIDEINVDYALVVDGLDVLCLQALPEISEIMRGGILAASIEHPGGRYLDDKIYCGNFLNAGVTFWDVERSRPLRQEVVQRGKIRYRNDVDDQLALNEVVYAKYLDDLRILPCTYNFRAYLKRRVRGWPTCQNFNGVKIYHHDECLKAKELLPVKNSPDMPTLVPEVGPCPKWKQLLRRLRQRLKPHLIR